MGRSLQATVVDNSVCVEKCTGGQRLVVLLGWGGALKKHLSRIRALYLAEGYAVVSYISPMSCLLQGGLVENDIVELADTVRRELPQVERKTFHVHLFSNNGTFVWGALTLALKDSAPTVFDALTGIVLDSAPRLGPKPPNLLMQALGLTFPCIPIMLRRSQYVHPVWTPALFLYFLIRMAWMRLNPSTARRFQLANVKDAVLFGMPSTVPQLYIYSAKDKLITSAAVEDFMAMQQKRGVRITTKRFDDTPHIQHFLRKESEYKEVLLAFLLAT